MSRKDIKFIAITSVIMIVSILVVYFFISNQITEKFYWISTGVIAVMMFIVVTRYSNEIDNSQ